MDKQVVNLCEQQVRDLFPDGYINNSGNQRDLVVSLLLTFLPEKGYRDTWCGQMYTVISWFDEGTFPDLVRGDYDSLIDMDSKLEFSQPLDILDMVSDDKILETLQKLIEDKTHQIKQRILEIYKVQLSIFDYDELWINDDDEDDIITYLIEDKVSKNMIKSMLPELKTIKN